MTVKNVLKQYLRKGFSLLGVLGMVVMLTLAVLPPAPVSAAPADAYWVGDGGDWSDAANHWAVATGGAPGAGNLPDATTNVHFDANSFTVGGQEVLVDVVGSFQDMDWTGATNTPSLTIDLDLKAYGNVTFIPAMVINQIGTQHLRFEAVAGTQTLTTNGLTLAFVVFVDGGGTLSLLDDLSVWYISFYNGIITTNGNVITINGPGGVFFKTTSVKVLNLGSSVITTPTWNGGSATNLTVNAGTSTIKVAGTGLFKGLGATYNNVELNGTAHTISDSNTFSTLTLQPATTQTITFTDGTTQTASTLELTGSVGNVKTLQGSGVGGWALSQAAGVVNVDYVDISRSTAGGGATFNANGVSIDSGNNVGWNFTQTVSTQVATGVTANNYTMNGTLTDLGGDPATTTVFFEFGPTAALGSSTIPVAQTTPGAFSLTQATPMSDTTIFYRAGTTNAGSTVYGAISSISVPAAAGGMMIRTLLRLILASAILVTVLQVGMKGTGVPFLVIALLGVVAFALIDAMIIALF